MTSFQKYNNGLDGNVSGTSFLEFWKVLELVALGDKEDQGLAQSKVANRIGSILKDEVYRDAIEALCNKRNYITHVGSLPEFTQEELGTLRQISEASIMFLLSISDLFEDEPTLDYFYQLDTKCEKDLDRMTKVIDEVKRLRK
ncbi:MAG TPA: hypothetical protein VJ574_01200 [Candidatus Bathyarchaeia archaeon]|nr:hypothetical protein [Candidatus Bathyarchaeia archaeon]